MKSINLNNVVYHVGGLWLSHASLVILPHLVSYSHSPHLSTQKSVSHIINIKHDLKFIAFLFFKQNFVTESAVMWSRQHRDLTKTTKVTVVSRDR